LGCNGDRGRREVIVKISYCRKLGRREARGGRISLNTRKENMTYGKKG
jgi:hypothetical protein